MVVARSVFMGETHVVFVQHPDGVLRLPIGDVASVGVTQARRVLREVTGLAGEGWKMVPFGHAGAARSRRGITPVQVWTCDVGDAYRRMVSESVSASAGGGGGTVVWVSPAFIPPTCDPAMVALLSRAGVAVPEAVQARNFDLLQRQRTRMAAQRRTGVGGAS